MHGAQDPAGRLGCEADTLGSQSQASQITAEQAFELKSAGELCCFSISSQALLRATYAGQVLKCGGRILWSKVVVAEGIKGEDDDGGYSHNSSEPTDVHIMPRVRGLYALSHATTVIDDFWSHNWAASVSSKVFLLLFENNVLPSLILGFLAAMVSFLLACTGILPTFTHRSWSHGIDDAEQFSSGLWCTVFGAVTSASTLFLWRSSRRIFLDKVCIDQLDDRRKLSGIVGLGAFLKASRNMLVLWDPLYVTRLWCVFELAAYSKLMAEDKSKRFRILPLTLGPGCLLVFFWMILSYGLSSINYQATVFLLIQIANYATGLYARISQRQASIFRDQMADFTFDTAQCHCCAIGHRRHDGASIPCDRKIVTLCVNAWFGSSARFDEFVRLELCPQFHQQTADFRPPYSWILFAVSPSFWSHLVEAAAIINAGGTSGDAWASILQGLTLWLCVCPSYVALVFMFASLCKPTVYSVMEGVMAVLCVIPALVISLGSLILATSVSSILAEDGILKSCAIFTILLLELGALFNRDLIRSMLTAPMHSRVTPNIGIHSAAVSKPFDMSNTDVADDPSGLSKLDLECPMRQSVTEVRRLVSFELEAKRREPESRPGQSSRRG